MSSTMSHQPPKIPDTNMTPSHEWASDTLGTVHNAAEATKGNAPTDDNPIPGAFPGSVSSTDEAEFSNTVRHVYSHVEKNAKEYLEPAQQNLAQTAQTVYASAEQAARQYLPQGVVNRLEQVGVLGAAKDHHPVSHPADTRPADATSLPSHETGSFHATHGGVGMLPGTPTESGVAKLPEERLQDLRDELPTHESGVFRPTHGGVGSLPGDKNEEGVAMLPEERKSGEAGSDQTPSREGHTSATPGEKRRDELPTRESGAFRPTHGGVGSLPGGKNEEGVAMLPEERKSGGEGYTPGGGVRDTGTEDVAPQKMTTPNAVQFLEGNADPDHQKQKPISATIPGTQAPTAGATKNEETSKPGLGTKIKAEAKILSGKVRKDEAKVEQGRAMKQGG